MPLLKGSANSIVSQNISDMRNAGHSEAQAVAASMKTAGRFGKGKKKKVAGKKKGVKPAFGKKPVAPVVPDEDMDGL